MSKNELDAKFVKAQAISPMPNIINN